MPTNANAYNSRLTDETLEKRFRDTFRSQGGAELVDDLYASGVIVPVVDFTAAAEGSSLRSDLQTAWDFTTNLSVNTGGSSSLISNAGFWKVDLSVTGFGVGGANNSAYLQLSDGLSTKKIWQITTTANSPAVGNIALEQSLVVFLRSGDTLSSVCVSGEHVMNVWYRQIATVSGDFVQPSGFTSS